MFECDKGIAERYVNQRNFYLTDRAGNGLRASIVRDGTEVRLTPISPVTEEEIYTLHVHKVRGGTMETWLLQ